MMCLVLGIKANERLDLSMQHICNGFNGEFSIEYLVSLERQIINSNRFRLNVPTPLDFAIHFIALQSEALEDGKMPITIDDLVTLTIPAIQFQMTMYEDSRRKYSSIALAAISFVVQAIDVKMKSFLTGQVVIG